MKQGSTRICCAAASCIAILAVTGIGLPGCATTYYKTMEVFGKEKLDLLVDRVTDAREDQADAKEQFKSALDRFSDLVNAPESDLRKAYDTAKADLERSEELAADVAKRIDAVENVGEDLFNEWEDELDQYTSDDLREKSRAELYSTKAKYAQMLAAMRTAEGNMEPVLNAFQDNVLFLKHNLNAQAVASMQGTVADLESEIASLIADMERSMAEADKFVAEIGKE